MSVVTSSVSRQKIISQQVPVIDVKIILGKISDEKTRANVGAWFESFKTFIEKLEVDDTLESVLEHISKYELLDSLCTILNGSDQKKVLNKLFTFAFDHGVYLLTRYLYEKCGVIYDTRISEKYYKTITSESKISLSSEMSEPVQTGLSNKDNLSVSIQDKFSPGRDRCYRYLILMKNYSRYFSFEKAFFYTFKSKYVGRVKVELD